MISKYLFTIRYDLNPWKHNKQDHEACQSSRIVFEPWRIFARYIMLLRNTSWSAFKTTTKYFWQPHILEWHTFNNTKAFLSGSWLIICVFCTKQVLLEPVSMWCCGNVFDKECISKVFRMKTQDNTSKCPVCRKPFFTLPQVRIYMCVLCVCVHLRLTIPDNFWIRNHERYEVILVCFV